VGSLQTLITAGALYLAARQTKNLQQSIEANVYLGIVERGNALFERALDYPRTLGPLLLPPSPTQMSPNDESEYYMQRCYLLSLFNLFHVVFLQHKRGVVDDMSWQRWQSLIGYWIKEHREFGRFWNELPVRNHRYHEGFVKFIDGLIKLQPSVT
jgi:hypothetical protein